VGYESFFFKLLKERVDEAWADFFFDASFELADYAVAMDGTFVEYGEYVEAAKVAD